MNYKKNVISVILWLLSAIMAGTGAMMVTMPSAPEESQWIGLVIAGVWLAVTGLVAFLLSRGLQKSREKKTNVDNRQTALVHLPWASQNLLSREFSPMWRTT